MKIELGYGCKSQVLYVADENVLGVLQQNEVQLSGKTAQELVTDAIRHPIGSLTLDRIIHRGEKIAIVTSDITRPLPSYEILPVLLRELFDCGVKATDVTVVFGIGSHRHHTPQEMRKLAGDYTYETVRCVDSNPDDCVRLGVTDRGTPVDITRVVAEADRRICLGNVEFHWFAGYSGGAKAIMPGVSTRSAITCNHGLMASSNACAAKIDGNPIREDIEQAGAICGVDFIVNVVLDAHKHIIYASAGNVTAAHRDACHTLDRLYLKPISRRADIVIVSQGGAPKDMNLYQTQKALANASHAVRDGGVIILVGACPEGAGERVFESWMRSAKTPQDILARIATEFCIGGHKAAAFARVLVRADIYLVSEMDDETVRAFFMTPVRTVQAALELAQKKLGADASVLVMPYGGATLPRVQEEA